MKNFKLALIFLVIGGMLMPAMPVDAKIRGGRITAPRSTMRQKQTYGTTDRQSKTGQKQNDKTEQKQTTTNNTQNSKPKSKLGAFFSGMAGAIFGGMLFHWLGGLFGGQFGGIMMILVGIGLGLLVAKFLGRKKRKNDQNYY